MSESFDERPSFQRYGGPAPLNYERYFVPAIALPLARDLVRRASLRRGERVLDLACGTGVVARLAAEAVGPAGAVAGVDVNPGMLETARSRPSVGRIEWHQAGAEALPLEDASYDVALCQLGLQFFRDRRAAVGELRRVLVPGGRLLASVPGPIPRVFEILAEELRGRVSVEAAGFVHQVFSLHDPAELEQLLDEAGFAEISVRGGKRVLRLPAPPEFLRQYVSSTPLGATLAELDEAQHRGFAAAVEARWSPFVDDGALVLRLPVVTSSASRATRRRSAA